MASMAQRGNTPSTQTARQFWSQHNWDNMERIRMLDPYAEPRNVPGERLESAIPIKGTLIIAKPSPVRMFHLMREGTITQVAAELETFNSAGGDVNERVLYDHVCPGVKELDTFLHVALRHRKADVARFLMMQGADAGIQNWFLETPHMVAEQVGLGFIIEQMNQSGTDTKWGGATLNHSRQPVQVAPQRSVLEAHYAWREGAPRTAARTKAVFNYYPGSNAMSTRKPVPALLPHQRENGPASAPLTGCPSGTRASRVDQPVAPRLPGNTGSNTTPNVAGSRHAGARITSSTTVYNSAGTAN